MDVDAVLMLTDCIAVVVILIDWAVVMLEVTGLLVVDEMVTVVAIGTGRVFVVGRGPPGGWGGEGFHHGFDSAGLTQY